MGLRGILGAFAMIAITGCYDGMLSSRGDDPDEDARAGLACDDEPEDPLPAEDGEAGIAEEDGGSETGEPVDTDGDAPEPIVPEDEYLVGDWNGDDIEDIAVRRDNCILREWTGDGLVDHTQCYGNGDGRRTRWASRMRIASR